MRITTLTTTNPLQSGFLLGLTIGAAGLLPAQGTLTTPKIDATTESGQRFSELGGKSASTRLMLIDGHHTSSTAKVLNGVAFRADRASSSGARSFSGVTVDMFHGNVATASATFSLNIISTPTRVFSGSVSWPAAGASVYPKSHPFAAKIPFTTLWPWDGKRAIGADIAMPKMTSGSGTYELDGMWGAISSVWPGQSHKFGTKNCVDSALTNGAYAYARVAMYPPFDGSNAGKFRYQGFARDLPPNHPVIFSFNVAASPVGIDLRVTCNKLWIVPFAGILVPISTDANGQTWSSWGNAYLPWDDSLMDKSLMAQAGWADSKTNQLKLTEAGGVNFGPQPVGGKYLNSRAYWAASATAATAISDKWNTYPVVQWSHL